VSNSTFSIIQQKRVCCERDSYYLVMIIVLKWSEKGKSMCLIKVQTLAQFHREWFNEVSYIS